jgi:putative holliday junction resolvase
MQVPCLVMLGMPEFEQNYGLDDPELISGLIMAFDFGTKRIGVAVGQVITQTATPLAPLAAKKGKPDAILLTGLINGWRPTALIVGIPLNMDGTEQPMTVRAREFGFYLKNCYQRPVYGMDERLTSREAREQLFSQGGYKALKNSSVDSVAARLILESWFSVHCNSNGI